MAWIPEAPFWNESLGGEALNLRKASGRRVVWIEERRRWRLVAEDTAAAVKRTIHVVDGKCVPEHGEAATKHGFAITEYVICQSYTWLEVKQGRFKPGQRNPRVDRVPQESGVRKLGNRLKRVLRIRDHRDRIAGRAIDIALTAPNLSSSGGPVPLTDVVKA